MTKKNPTRTCLVILLALPLLLVIPSLIRITHSNEGRSFVPRNLRETAKEWKTLKFSASTADSSVLNVHIVPHTHDDVGWLKTVDQYYYGLNQTIQHAHVQSILTTVVQALLANPNRTFTYVETKYFSMWWAEQCEHVKDSVKSLIQNGQFLFVNGGWCMHDEGATHFMGMIDQTTLGHDFLSKELGVIPTIGWQLDPFGHSATQASYMTHEMGFDALYFGRIDYQDLKKRHDEQECEGLWASSENLPDVSTFWGLTGEYGGQYGPPSGFCFDIHCDDEPLMAMDEKQLLDQVAKWANGLQIQASRTKGNHIMQTMGEDFKYEQAAIDFANYDLLISKLLEYQDSTQIDVASIFGPRFNRLNIFYSNPAYYTEMKYKEASTNSGDIHWTTKNDDFMPYAIREHGYLTGYFTSRSGFKRLERVGSSFLLAARQIESLNRDGFDIGMSDCTDTNPLHELEDALGVSQHHDAVSGTAKQHVADDYAKRLQSGIDNVASFVIKKIKKLILDESNADTYLNDMMFCQLLNETKCDTVEDASRSGDRDIYILVYNPLAVAQQTVIGIPVAIPIPKRKLLVNRVGDSNFLRSTMVLPTDEDGKHIYRFETGTLPPTGTMIYKLSWGEEIKGDDLKSRLIISDNAVEGDASTTTTFSNGVLTVDFDSATGRIQNVKTREGISVDLTQEWGYYTSYDSRFHKDGYYQNSGAYIFRPSEPQGNITRIKPRNATFHMSELVSEVHVQFEQPWIQQTMRLNDKTNYIEVEYTVGPIPIDDDIGKEVITKYSSSIESDHVFFTDSNGREFQKRVRHCRSTWHLNETEPIAGNYYPVNAAIYVEDKVRSMSLVTDRSVGGSSLVDGSIEVMVHRRILRDDSLGVFEALNETTKGVTPYPPYGDATRRGDGIIIKGIHRLLIGGGGDGATLARSQMDAMFASPLVFAASALSTTSVPLINDTFALLQEALPSNVMLITYKLLSESPVTTFLVRLGHQYGKGEDPQLSEPVQICLGMVVSPYSIVSISEKTLSGNQGLDKWLRKKMNWTNGVVQSRQPVVCLGDNCIIELNPMEIRTFQIHVRTGGVDSE